MVEWTEQHTKVGMDLVEQMILLIGESPDRDGLRATPGRVVRSWRELFSGYNYTEHDIKNMLTQFDGTGYDELIVLRNISFQSICEHHLLGFSGIAHIGYIPKDGRVVGISKLARLLEVYSRRLQIQERITTQITGALMEYLQPGGAACVLVAHHSCMSCRGIKKETAEMITSSLVGCFRDDQKCRSEFLSFIGV